MKTRASRQALRITLLYIFLAGAWTLGCNALLKRSVNNLNTGFAIGAIKDWGFMVLMGSLLFQVLRRLLGQWEKELEQRQASENDFRRTQRALKTVSECNGVLVRASCEAALLAEICRVVIEKGGYRMAWVGFPSNDEQKSVRVAARSGYDNGYLEQSRITWSEADERGRGPTGTAIRSGQIIVCNDFFSDPQAAPWRAEATQRGYASTIVLPLSDGGKTCGVLSIYATKVNAFNATEVELLKELADDLAYGIRALRTQIERTRAEQSLRAAEEKYRRIFEGARDAISTLDPITGKYVSGNPAAVKMFGVENEAEFLLHGPEDFSPERQPDGGLSADSVLTFNEKLMQEGQQFFEWKHRRLDGEEFMADVLLTHMERDGKPLVLATMRDSTQRRQAEAILRESEQKFSKMFHSSPLPMLLSTVEGGRYLDVNDEFLKAIQRSREEVIGHTSLELNVLADPEQRAAVVGRLEKRGSVRDVELQIHTKSGQVRDILWSAEVVDIAGEQCWLGSMLDITVRQRVMEMLQETAGQLLEAQRIAGLGSYIFDAKTGCWTSSEALDELFGIVDPGFTKNTLSWLQIVHPEDRAEMDRYLQDELFKGHGTFDRTYRIIRQHDHQERWVHGLGKLVLDEQGQVAQMLGTIQDITQSQRAEAQVHLQSTALTAAANAIAITDHSGKIEWVNPAFAKLTGYSAAKAIGQYPRILKSGQHPPEFYANMWATISGGTMWHGELINKCKDGRISIEDTTITQVRDANGGITHFVAIKQDITQARQLEAQLRQSQKMEAIGQLAGGVAHDFNNILSSLIMQADLIEMAEFLPAEVTEGLKQIRADALRAAQLTRQLLLFGRRQVMQSCLLDLNEVVTNLAKMLQRIIGEDVRLQLNLHPVPLMTCADAGMVEQMLMNLAVNARDAMPKGGRLGIETAEKIVTGDLSGLYPDALPGRYVCFSVSDTGTGIPPEILPQIFEPFFTTKAAGKGTGLGLATVFGIVKQHHGWLKVDNQPGQGVTFRIFLPARTVSTDEAAQTEAKPRPQGGNETILLVEDEAGVRKSIQSLLERRGYQVLAAANGIEALDLWLTHGRNVALLLTDLVMPGGMTGYELARQFQSGQSRLKTIYMSGYSAEIAGREIELRPGEMFIQKPCAANKLFEAIRRSLDG